MYKLRENFNGETYLERLSDGAHIRMSEENRDYQAYLKWVEEGNTPEPADEPQ